LLVRLGRAVRAARQGSDAAAVEATRLQEELSNHECRVPAERKQGAPLSAGHTTGGTSSATSPSEDEVCQRAFVGFQALVDGCNATYARSPDARQMLVGAALSVEQTACLKAGGPQYPALRQSCVDAYSRCPDARIMLAGKELETEHRACLRQGSPQHPVLWQAC